MPVFRAKHFFPNIRHHATRLPSIGEVLVLVEEAEPLHGFREWRLLVGRRPRELAYFPPLAAANLVGHHIAKRIASLGVAKQVRPQMVHHARHPRGGEPVEPLLSLQVVVDRCG